MILVSFVTILYEPLYQLFFDGCGSFNVTSLVLDTILLGDGPMNAFTAYITPEQTVVYNPRALVQNYFRRGTRWIFGLTTMVAFVAGWIPSWYWVALSMRLIRVLRFVSPGTGTYAEHFEFVSLTQIGTRLLLILVGILLYVNLLGCVYRYLWNHWRETPEFYPLLYEFEDSDMWALYVATYRVTMGMLVNGETSPCLGMFENLFGIVVSLSMIIVMSLVISECSILMSYLLRDDMDFQCELDRMQSFLRRRKIPLELQKEVIEFVRHRYDNEVAYDAALMHQLPSALVFKIRSVMLGDIGSRVPIFRCADPEYIRCLMVKLQYHFYLASDLVYHHGDLDQRMFLLMNGKISLASRDGDILTVLTNGAHFGEDAVLLEKHRRSMSARALVYSDCCFIGRDDLDEIHHEFPDRRALLETISERRRSCCAKDVFFNDDMVVENALLKHDTIESDQNAVHRLESSGIPIKFFASELKNLHLRRNVSMGHGVLLKRDAIARAHESHSNIMAVAGTTLRKSSHQLSNAWRRRSATVIQLMRFKDKDSESNLSIVPEHPKTPS